MDLSLYFKKRIRYRHAQEKNLSHFENFDFFEKIVKKLFLTYDMKDDVYIELETTEYTDSDHLESPRVISMMSLSKYDVIMASLNLLPLDNHSRKKLTHLNYKLIVFGQFLGKNVTRSYFMPFGVTSGHFLLPVCFILFEQGTHVGQISKFHVLTSSDPK